MVPWSQLWYQTLHFLGLSSGPWFKILFLSEPLSSVAVVPVCCPALICPRPSCYSRPEFVLLSHCSCQELVFQAQVCLPALAPNCPSSRVGVPALSCCSFLAQSCRSCPQVAIPQELELLSSVGASGLSCSSRLVSIPARSGHQEAGGL